MPVQATPIPEAPVAPVIFKLASPHSLLSTSWAIYKKHVSFLIIFCLAGLGIMMLATIPVVALAVAGGITKSALLVILAVLFIIPVIYIAVWWKMAFVRVAKTISGTEVSPKIRESLNWKGRKDVWRYFGLGILTVLIVFGGTLLFIIPGILFAVWFSFSSYAFIFDGTGIRESLRTSKKLVKGRFWKVLWRFIYPALIQILFYIALGILTAILAAMFGTVFGQIINGLGRIALGFIWSPLLLIYTYHLYENLKQNSIVKTTA